MEKNQFIEILHRYTDCSVEEAQKLLDLKETYPYSQMLHALAAKVSKHHGFHSQHEELQLAAVYACDRAILKDIMTKESLPPVSSESFITTAEAEVSASAEPDEDVAAKVIHDLQRLSELKLGFEAMFTDETTMSVKAPSDSKLSSSETSEPEASEAESSEQAAVEEKSKKKSGKTKAQRIVELAKALESEETKVNEEGTGEELIKEIKNTKKKILPENEKQKEQIEIIDQFIKAQPSILSAKDKILAPPAGDLSSIKSGEFGDNVISETLVEILLRQGKKDKAIEVLKKLIWKFPQKKAYFAAQIEELRK